jgi:hypothetical protein
MDKPASNPVRACRALDARRTDPGRRRAEIPEDDNNHVLGDAAT